MDKYPYMKYLKNVLLIIILITFGFASGWWGKYEYEKAECIKEHDNCYQLQQKATDQPTVTQENDTTEEDYRCEMVVSKAPLILQDETIRINCDSAYTTFEVNLCTGAEDCLERKKFDSLNQIILHIYDSLIIEQHKEINQWLEEGDSTMVEYVTDYKTIKKLHIESTDLFLKYSELEREKTGIEIGTGRARVAYENMRHIEILQHKNKELEDFIKEYINEDNENDF